jgi:hypothetical protein
MIFRWLRSVPRTVRPLTVLGAMTLTLATGTLCATPAKADLKVVQLKTLTGLEELDAYSVPRTITYYWKGDRYREDPPGDIYYIYDCAKDRYYIINRATQQYTVKTLKDAMGERKGLIQNLKIEGNATVEDGGSVKTISGQKAKNLTLSMDLRLRLESNGATVLTVKMEGEQWVTSGNAGVDAKCQKIIQASYARGIFRYNKLLEPLYAKLTAFKGVPLNYDMILNLSALSPTEGIGGGTIEAHSEVKSVSTKALPASLFVVPKGYMLVDDIKTDDG